MYECIRRTDVNTLLAHVRRTSLDNGYIFAEPFTVYFTLSNIYVRRNIVTMYGCIRRTDVNALVAYVRRTPLDC